MYFIRTFKERLHGSECDIFAREAVPAVGIDQNFYGFVIKKQSKILHQERSSIKLGVYHEDF